MILFYRQFFMLHSKKSILQVKIQRLRNNCRHVRFLKPFLRWKLKKNLKRVQDERWGLEFLHIQAQYSGESCCKMVGAIARPHWGCMGSACCGPIAPHKAAPAYFGVFLAGPCPKSCITPQFRPIGDPILKVSAQFASGGAPQCSSALSFYVLISL